MLRINVAVADPRVGEMLLAKRYQMECIEETRVDPDIIAGIKNGRWSIPWVHCQTLAMKWALCVMMKRGLMTKEGVYKLDVALRMVPREERDAAEKLIDSCLSPKAIPAENIAFEFIHCFQDTKSNYSVSIFI
nr:odorant binding protein 37 [Spodoptera frugiperda]